MAKTSNETFRIAEAIALANARGYQVKKKDIAKKLWADCSEQSAMINLSNLIRGKVKRISIDMVAIICKELHCTPNFLFDYE